jgi:hypothetical protein
MPAIVIRQKGRAAETRYPKSSPSTRAEPVILVKINPADARDPQANGDQSGICFGDYPSARIHDCFGRGRAPGQSFVVLRIFVFEQVEGSGERGTR